jgi:hypothetical protein
MGLVESDIPRWASILDGLRSKRKLLATLARPTNPSQYTWRHQSALDFRLLLPDVMTIAG